MAKPQVPEPYIVNSDTLTPELKTSTAYAKVYESTEPEQPSAESEGELASEKSLDDKIYDWATHFDTELKEIFPEDYLWSDEARMLLRRLEKTSGQLLAVIGLQGSGKTALREVLSIELEERMGEAISFKWDIRPESRAI